MSMAATCRPRMTMADGSKVDLGFSLATRSDTEAASYTAPTGEALQWSSSKRDETVVPVAGIKSYTTLGISSDLLGAYRTKESTTRILGAQEVSKNATNKAAASADLKTLNPVIEEAPAEAAPAAAIVTP